MNPTNSKGKVQNSKRAYLVFNFALLIFNFVFAPRAEAANASDAIIVYNRQEYRPVWRDLTDENSEKANDIEPSRQAKERIFRGLQSYI